MSGIYIHIPFCKSKCYYCDFYSSVSLEHKSEFINKLCEEIKLREDYLPSNKIETVYFGGGTPTLLSSNEINKIFEHILKYYEVSNSAEITIEANPDDLTVAYLKELKTTPINRISIGIQSFSDDDLKLMNRRHNALEAINAIKNAQNTGFTNLSGDLIYGLPGMTGEKWLKNLHTFFELKIQHLSAYHITYEENTKFYELRKTNKIQALDEEKSKELFTILCNESEKNNFIQYEISNFAKEGCLSQHNSSYWKNKTYIGFGTSAHSYKKKSRQWNVSNLTQYIAQVGEGSGFYDFEILTENDKFNEYIITSLRTMWGIDIDYIKNQFGEKYFNFMLNKIRRYAASGHIIKKDKSFILSREGMFISDLILENLFYI